MRVRRSAAAGLAASVGLLGWPLATAAADAGMGPPSTTTSDAVTFTPTLELMTGGFVHDGAWFGLAEGVDPSFDPQRAWLEGWVEIGASLSARPAPGFEVYGRASLGASGTLGSDPFEQGDGGKVELENLYAGIRYAAEGNPWSFDLSYGQQDFGVGTGMLIWQGAGNGFERGAVSILPRTAWSQAAVAKVGYAGHSVQAFFLDPNELDSSDTGTQLAGATWRYDRPSGTNVGLAYVNVLQSGMVYPTPAPPFFIEDGRDGLQAFQAFARLAGEDIDVPGLYLRGEFAYEWKSDVVGSSDLEASAIYGEAGYRFASLPMSPTLSYSFASFSGDDPDTDTYERFDPLYYGNGLDNWWFGANGSYAFLNSNVSFHRIGVQLLATERDFLKFQYIHARANQSGSPVQFGRPDDGFGIAFGVDDRHLSDEIYGEWTHLFTPQTSVTLWGSMAFPGAGIDEAIPSGDGDPWLATGLVVSARF
jgi:hypothetical protein